MSVNMYTSIHLQEGDLDSVDFHLDADGELVFAPMAFYASIYFQGPGLEAIDTLLHKLSVLRQEIAPDTPSTVNEDGAEDR